VSVFEHQDFDGHERIVFVDEEKTGLRAIIAIHNTTRGPSLGGCRLKRYDCEDAALADALRLSRGMTYKAAIADLDFGGGKSVILDCGKPIDRRALFEAMARAVDRLGGAYIVSNDLGTTVQDVVIMREYTEHARGLPAADGNQHPATAYGVYLGLKATAKFINGTPALEGLHIAVQGVGTVGEQVARYALADGARLTIADTSAKRLERWADDRRVSVVSPAEVLGVQCDILAPCAIGAVLNDNTIPAIHARGVCGAANNQLLARYHGDLLHRRGIAYAPDYVVNAGGLIEVAKEGAWISSDDTLLACETIYYTLTEIFEQSKANGLPPHIVADQLAEQRLGRTYRRIP
jgi:leucine dehydrogenase